MLRRITNFGNKGALGGREYGRRGEAGAGALDVERHGLINVREIFTIYASHKWFAWKSSVAVAGVGITTGTALVGRRQTAAARKDWQKTNRPRWLKWGLEQKLQTRFYMRTFSKSAGLTLRMLLGLMILVMVVSTAASVMSAWQNYVISNRVVRLVEADKTLFATIDSVRLNRGRAQTALLSEADAPAKLLVLK